MRHQIKFNKKVLLFCGMVGLTMVLPVVGSEGVCRRLLDVIATRCDYNDSGWLKKYVAVPLISGMVGFVVSMGVSAIVYEPYRDNFASLLGTYSVVFVPVGLALPFVWYYTSKKRCTYCQILNGCPTLFGKEEERVKLINGGGVSKS